MRLLIAEDDPLLADTLARGFREHAYAVDVATDGAQALSLARINDYDAVVLDIMMPRCDGLSVCAALRGAGQHVPILMLTARDALSDKVAGLDAGADDYVTKPFELDELLARVRALVRRRGEVQPGEIVLGDLVVDTRRQRARRGTRDIELTSKEYALLEYLARNAGRIVSRTEISAHVWDDNHDPLSNALEVLISRLRRKIDEGEPLALLHTRRAAGYMLAMPDGGASGASASRSDDSS